MAKKDNLGVKKPFYKCEEFWGSVVAVAIPMSNSFFDLGLSVEEVTSLMVPPLLFVINEIVVNKEESKKD